MPSSPNYLPWEWRKEHRYLLRRWVNVTQLSWAVQLYGIKWKPPICWQNICPDWLNTSSPYSEQDQASASSSSSRGKLRALKPCDGGSSVKRPFGRTKGSRYSGSRTQALAYVPQGRLLRRSAPPKSKCSPTKKVSSQLFESQEGLWRPFRAKGREQQLGCSWTILSVF